jgi:hypothetical protein
MIRSGHLYLFVFHVLAPRGLNAVIKAAASGKVFRINKGRLSKKSCSHAEL